MSVTLQKRGGSGSGGYRLPCETTVSVGDYVYIQPDGVLDKAIASDITTMPAIGKVSSKPSANVCIVSDKLIDSDYTGVTPKGQMFVSGSVAGTIEDVPPAGANVVIQQVGIGLSNEQVLVDIDASNIVIRT